MHAHHPCSCLPHGRAGKKAASTLKASAPKAPAPATYPLAPPVPPAEGVARFAFDTPSPDDRVLAARAGGGVSKPGLPPPDAPGPSGRNDGGGGARQEAGAAGGTSSTLAGAALLTMRGSLAVGSPFALQRTPDAADVTHARQGRTCSDDDVISSLERAPCWLPPSLEQAAEQQARQACRCCASASARLRPRPPAPRPPARPPRRQAAMAEPQQRRLSPQGQGRALGQHQGLPRRRRGTQAGLRRSTSWSQTWHASARRPPRRRPAAARAPSRSCTSWSWATWTPASPRSWAACCTTWGARAAPAAVSGCSLLGTQPAMALEMSIRSGWQWCRGGQRLPCPSCYMPSGLSGVNGEGKGVKHMLQAGKGV